MEKYVKCFICGKLYELFSHTTENQSMCGECLKEAEKALIRKSNQEEIDARNKYFGN